MAWVPLFLLWLGIGESSKIFLIALGAFFPVFGDGNTVVAILVASAGIWLFHFMILRGTQQAAVINSINGQLTKSNEFLAAISVWHVYSRRLRGDDPFQGDHL